MKIFKLLGLILTLGIINAEVSKPNIYKQIGTQYLLSFDPMPVQDASKQPEKFLGLLPKIEIKAENITTTEKRKLAIDILSQNVKTFDANSISNKSLWKDIELFFGGQDNKTHLISKINNTETVFGEIALCKKLTEPSSDITTLKQQQAMIQELIKNEKLFNELNSALSKFKESENTILSFWKAENWFTELYIENATTFKIFKPLNNNEAAFGAFRRMNQLLNSLSLGYGYHYVYTFSKAFWDKNKTAALALSSIIGLYYAFITSVAIHSEREQLALEKNLQNRLILINSFVNGLEQTYKSLQTNKAFQVGFGYSLKSMNNFLSQPEKSSEELAILLEKLNTETFKGKASMFSNVGRILYTSRLTRTLKNQMVDALKAFGELDAIMSIAKLYKKHQNKNVTYSFVNYMDAYSPYIKLEEFWHPFISENTVVTNSIELGSKQKQNIILTGPNAGGKSTVLKAITINLLLAQTLGIAPAKSATITPFAKINTYLNIVDDLSSGNSLFKTEVLRTQELIESIKNLGDKNFSFSVIDEMFSGTAPKEGEAAAYSISKYLSKLNNSICLIATHYPKLTELEKNSTYKNYQVKVVKNPDGTLTYPHKLEEGKVSQNIALDILRLEGFSSEMLDEAYKILGQ